MNITESRDEAFEAIAEIIEATNDIHKQWWYLTPILGSSGSAEVNIS